MYLRVQQNCEIRSSLRSGTIPKCSSPPPSPPLPSLLSLNSPEDPLTAQLQLLVVVEALHLHHLMRIRESCQRREQQRAALRRNNDI